TTLDTAAGENAHISPAFLPDDRHFLYFARGTTAGAAEVAGTFIGALDSTDVKQRLNVGPSARYAQGALLFMRDNALVAQPFNISSLQASGAETRIADGVDVGGSTGRAGAFAVADNGVVAYQ